MNPAPHRQIIYSDYQPFADVEPQETAFETFMQRILPTYITALVVCASLGFLAGRLVHGF